MRVSSLVTALLTVTLAAAVNNTIGLFLPEAYEPIVAFGASVIGVCSDRTVYDVQCTRGVFASTVTCNSNGPRFTVTEGPSMYLASTRTSFGGAVMTLTESCALSGTTRASCDATALFSSDFQTRSTTTSSILSGPTVAEFYICNVDIVATAANLVEGGIACSESGSAANSVFSASVIAAFLLTVVVIL